MAGRPITYRKLHINPFFLPFLLVHIRWMCSFNCLLTFGLLSHVLHIAHYRCIVTVMAIRGCGGLRSRWRLLSWSTSMWRGTWIRLHVTLCAPSLSTRNCGLSWMSTSLKMGMKMKIGEVQVRVFLFNYIFYFVFLQVCVNIFLMLVVYCETLPQDFCNHTPSLVLTSILCSKECNTYIAIFILVIYACWRIILLIYICGI